MRPASREELADQVDALEQALESDAGEAVSDRLQRIQSLSAALEERDAVTRQELRDEQYRLEQRGRLQKRLPDTEPFRRTISPT